MTLPVMRSGLTSREFLRIAGGYGVAEVGKSPAGGLDIDNAGNLATDGDVTIDGTLDVQGGDIMNTTGDLSLDAQNASTNSTVFVKNSDGAFVAHLDVEGDLDVGGTSTFSSDVTVSHGTNPAIKISEAAGKFLLLQDRGGGLCRIVEVNDAGAAVINLDPNPLDGTSPALVRLFRELTNTTGAREFEIYKGDGSTDVTFEVIASNGNVMSKGDIEAQGGDVKAGTDGGTRGVLTAWDGSGGSAPGCLKLASPNGTIWYVFAEDDGTLKISSALPTQNIDGAEIGTQT